MNFMLPLGVGVALIASRRHSRSDEAEPVHTGPSSQATASASGPSDSSSEKRVQQEGETADKKMNAEKVKAGGGDGPDGNLPGAEQPEPTKKVTIRIDSELEEGAMQRKVAAYREQIVKHIVSSGEIKVTLEGFPYYMSESTKTLLINSATTFLKRHQFVKYMKQLSTISPRIMLVGPVGSEAYQETTVKALARQFGAKLLVFDNTAISLDVQYPATPRVTPMKAEINGLDMLEGDEASSSDSKDVSPSGHRLARTSSLGLKADDLTEPSIKEFLSWVQDQLKSQARTASAVDKENAPPSPKSPTKQPPIPLDHVLDLLHEYGDKLERTNSGDVLRTSSGNLHRTNSGCVECIKRTSSVASSLLSDDDAGQAAGDAAGGEIEPKEAKEAAPLAKKELTLEDRVVFIGSTAAKNSTFTTFGGFHGKLAKKREAEPNLGVIFDGPFPGGHSLNGACDDGRGYYCYENELRLEGASDETKALIDALFEVISEESADPLIVYIRDVENWILNNFEAYTSFKKRIERVEGRVLVMTSYISKEVAAAAPAGKDDKKEVLPSVPSQLAQLFPSEILIRPPQDETMLDQWKRQLKKDSETMRADANRKMLRQVLASSNIKCGGLNTIQIEDKLLTEELAKKVAGWAANHYLVSAEKPEVRNSKLVISTASLHHAIEMLNSIHEDSNSAKKALQDVVIDNDFEKNLLSEVIPANELGVDFADVGALDDVKDTLKELVMLPLQFPDLFAKSQLTKPCKGILLFGPPGTGKTMLAKAVATEAGANFINVSMSKITSKWFGEDEKYVRALFTLASKIAPCTIFIDEVDSMLGRRDSRHEAEAMRKIKNEFMTCWDGLRTREKERVLVLAATNRPFDLDEAVLRRFPRRVMIPLPDVENREKILRVILEKEELGSDIDYKELADATEGYSGSDLKNMCVTAAYRPVRELLNKLKKDKEAAKAAGQDQESVVPPGVRPLSMDDLRKAREQVAASVSPEASIVQELMQWNEQYGEGGSRKKPALTYFM